MKRRIDPKALMEAIDFFDREAMLVERAVKKLKRAVLDRCGLKRGASAKPKTRRPRAPKAAPTEATTTTVN